MTTIPAWVLERIATTTGLDPRQGRAAQAAVCPRCRQPVLRGLDSDRCAFTATTDPARLTPVGEVQALLTGRATYALAGKPAALEYRCREHIKGRPATENRVVLADHACGAPALSAYPDKPTRPIARKGGGNEQPPF